MAEAQSILDLLKIRAYAPNKRLLESINGTLGTALGFKKRTNEPISNNPAIIVFVPEKINPKWIPNSQLIPDKLEGPDNLWCYLDIVEGGKAEEEDPVSDDYSELAERLRGWDDQVWSGSQVSHWVDQNKGSYSMGTLGAFVKSRDDHSIGFLTNKHVAIERGKKLYHPVPWGTHIGTTERIRTYVTDEDWYGVDEPDAYVRIDSAFVKLADNFKTENVNYHMMGIGELGSVKEISLNDMSIIGQKVLRVGRTTGLRRGRVVAFGYEWSDENTQSLYTDLLIIGQDNKPFSTHGDSGSLIVTDDDQHNSIGLLWGGWQEKLRTGYGQENWTYGISLSRVLNELRIDLVT